MDKRSVLCTSLDPEVIEAFKKEEPECIYCFQKSYTPIKDSYLNKKINYVEMSDCKKFINKVDLIIIDLKLKNKEQYISLKNLLKLLMKSNLKQDLKLVTVNKSKKKNLLDESSIYEDYINYFLEGVLKFRGLRS
jgi:hypothetical protein